MTTPILTAGRAVDRNGITFKINYVHSKGTFHGLMHESGEKLPSHVAGSFIFLDDLVTKFVVDRKSDLKTLPSVVVEGLEVEFGLRVNDEDKDE